jgi:hypothetical protein
MGERRKLAAEGVGATGGAGMDLPGATCLSPFWESSTSVDRTRRWQTVEDERLRLAVHPLNGVIVLHQADRNGSHQGFVRQIN